MAAVQLQYLLTTCLAVLGALVTVHPPAADSKWGKWDSWGKRTYVTAILAIALGAVVCAGIQNYQDSRAQAGLRNGVQTLSTKVATLTSSVHDEDVRRMQAEKDLAIMVKSAGDATLSGIQSDMKAQSPTPAVEAILKQNSDALAALASASQSEAADQHATALQLHDKAVDLANRLRQLQSQFNSAETQITDDEEKAFRQDATQHVPSGSIAAPSQDQRDKQEKIDAAFEAAENELWDRQRQAFGPLRAEGVILREEILGRIAEPNMPPQMKGEVQMTLDEGFLAGPYPLFSLADYFDLLASKLVPQE